VAELSAMRALGFGERRLTQLVMLEAVFLGAIGAVFGVALAFPLIDLWIGRWVESTLAALLPEFRLQPLSAVWLIGIALAGSALMTLWTARRVVRLPLAQALRQVA
jgi:putative ABC transport system permease protein